MSFTTAHEGPFRNSHRRDSCSLTIDLGKAEPVLPMQYGYISI